MKSWWCSYSSISTKRAVMQVTTLGTLRPPGRKHSHHSLKTSVYCCCCCCYCWCCDCSSFMSKTEQCFSEIFLVFLYLSGSKSKLAALTFSQEKSSRPSLSEWMDVCVCVWVYVCLAASLSLSLPLVLSLLSTKMFERTNGRFSDVWRCFGRPLECHLIRGFSHNLPRNHLVQITGFKCSRIIKFCRVSPTFPKDAKPVYSMAPLVAVRDSLFQPSSLPQSTVHELAKAATACLVRYPTSVIMWPHGNFRLQTDVGEGLGTRDASLFHVHSHT